MPPARRRTNRHQRFSDTVTGECGHACDAWPRLGTGKGEKVLCIRCEGWVKISIPNEQLSIEDIDQGEETGPGF